MLNILKYHEINVYSLPPLGYKNNCLPDHQPQRDGIAHCFCTPLPILRTHQHTLT